MSSGDLTGEDAFEKVLEALTSTHVDLRLALDDKQDLQQKLHLLEAKYRTLESDTTLLRIQNETHQKNTRLLAELWESANNLVRACKESEAATRLKKALGNAADACDQIPF